MRIDIWSDIGRTSISDTLAGLAHTVCRGPTGIPCGYTTGGEVWRSELSGGTVMTDGGAAEEHRRLGSFCWEWEVENDEVSTQQKVQQARAWSACLQWRHRARETGACRGALAYGPAETSRLVWVHHEGVEESVCRRARRVTRVARTTSRAGRGRGALHLILCHLAPFKNA
jgi:hypothetical protein